jgi:hypothetical protein
MKTVHDLSYFVTIHNGFAVSLGSLEYMSTNL